MFTGIGKKRIALVLAVVMGILMLVPCASATTFSGIVYMNATFECGCKRTGGGALVGLNVLITAAHNLVCSTHNKSLKYCNFFFGYDGNSYKKEYRGIFHYCWYSDFSKGYNSRDDIGYVIFDEKVGSQIGFFDIGVIGPEEDSWSWGYYNIYGYSGKKLVTDWKKLSGIDSKQIHWSMSSDFSGTLEGGPVESGNMVFAVYTSHSGSTGYGRLLTVDIIQDILDDGGNFGYD